MFGDNLLISILIITAGSALLGAAFDNILLGLGAFFINLGIVIAMDN